VADRAAVGARIIGRYELYGEIAAGGMATVHFGRLLGQAGFSRTVAIKRLHAHFAKDPDFVSMFVDEARIAARISHPNVVPTLDVVARDGELFLVMDYVSGEPLSKLMRAVAARGERVPPRIVTAIVSGVLHGLHAAHEARSERGEPLEIVHRDVSPQNVLVGADGVPRVVDFGVAKASGRIQTTVDGKMKGKPSYMAPEQLQGLHVSRSADVYASAVLLWELLTGARRFAGPNDAAVMLSVLNATPDAPSQRAPDVSPELDRITLRGLAPRPADRFATAQEMALALEAALHPALPSEVGAWVQAMAGSALTARAVRVAEIESSSGVELQRRSEAPAGPGAAEVSRVTAAAATGSVATVAPRRRGWLALGAVGVALVAAVLVAVSFAAGSRSRAPAAQAPSASPLPATSTVGPASPASAAPAAEIGSASPTPAGSPPAAVPVEPPASTAAPAASAAATGRAPRGAPRPAVPVTPRPAGCDPPYRIDASGHKIFKTECL